MTKNIIYVITGVINKIECALSYIYKTSRKKIYVPEYYDLIKNKNIINEYKKLLQDGKI